MISALFDQPNYAAAKKLLDATVLRHEAIASNLANVETPGYKRIDVAPAFKDELQRALSSQSTSKISNLKPQLMLDDNAVVQGRDGNTVQLENELLQLSKNFTAHAVETQLITSGMQRLRLAISGRNS